MKGIAARQNSDRAPTVPLDLAERVAHGTGPGKMTATDKIAREFQMARTADDELRRFDQSPGNRGQPFHAVFADADDGQPALPRAGCAPAFLGKAPTPLSL